MLRSVCKSKIHRARVTEADINYDGSITIDRTLMDAADLIPFEEVWVYDITNGNRLQTYVIEGEADSGFLVEQAECGRVAVVDRGQIDEGFEG